MALHLVHLILVCLWGGLLLAEAVLELLPGDAAFAMSVARIHLALDVVVELPLVAGLVVTGALLSAAVWPLTPVHVLKSGLALVAIGSNLTCFVLVRRRARATVADVGRYRRPILLTGLGAPFGVAAFYIGITRFAA